MIGSGATAITVVPALVEAGADVTLLQRSPTYVLSIPTTGGIGGWIRSRFSPRRAAFLLRWFGILMEIVNFNLARRYPNFFRRLFISGARKQLPPDIERRHLNPATTPGPSESVSPPTAITSPPFPARVPGSKPGTSSGSAPTGSTSARAARSRPT